MLLLYISWYQVRCIYRVAQNILDYLFLFSKFCISTTKQVNMIMYV